MTPLDPIVASVLDSHVQSIAENDHDEDALFAALEEDDAPLSYLREQRLQQLHAEIARTKAQRNEGYGTYVEVKEEKALMDATTSTKWCVVHFFKPDFNRCGIMDSHIEELAPKHLDTKFLRINVENAPFLVTKLKIQVLPCVLAFIDGVSVDRIVGFEGLGYSANTFATRDLEVRLLAAGVLQRAKASGGNDAKNALSRAAKKEESDGDDDWD
ncbi:MAG: hypothetical protein M1832_005772 [Thelocarpon impressellum]|nr:MAG: hypothetical protein M1832_005772 [Thelocarpon impressellum]